MTKFLDKSFSSRPSSREYRDNFDRVFGKEPDASEKRETEVDIVESSTIVQFTKPAHDSGCNCRLCRTARRAAGE